MKKFWDDLKTLINRPTDFFRSMPTQGGLSGPFAFAIVSSWIGAAFSHLWQSSFQEKLRQGVDALFSSMDGIPEVESLGRTVPLFQIKDWLQEWSTSVGWVLLDPFFTLAGLIGTSLLIGLGAKLLVPRETSYETSARILAYSQAAQVFAAIPFVGTLVASIYQSILLIIGCREVYQISTSRAVVVGLFPKLLFFGLGMIFIGGILFLIFGLFAAFVS